ncbi:secreted glucosidase [Cordyceps militaris CM01]|uniref:Secreted glucosidase n=1 Tax=Cordyceps militaris (strain CM01) TaxID=983644 RepID=G3JC81_CORMM|nr:secreted glucosidase [Cordyceps militaris CM01]EGX94596.1 secreted glucosidase [Cordyceps militaris CM01]
MVKGGFISSLLSLAAVARAWNAPNYGGFNLVWQDNFGGSAGQLPNEGNWNIIDGNLGINEELQTYKRNPRNVQLSGGDSLQIVPWRDGNGWTSGRIESKYTFTPEAGRITRVEGAIKFGDNGIEHKKGLWPAWWMLGNIFRQNKQWPACGELDILEAVNGELIGHGTMHCDVSPGGKCNEGAGIGSTVNFPNQDWHTWRLEIDLRPGNWVDQTVVWYLDGQEFHRIPGSTINNYDIWHAVAQSPLYFILNMAVGGKMPGSPNGETFDGYGSMMEVGYTAHYVSQ